MSRLLLRLALALGCLGSLSCGPTGVYTWYRDVPPSEWGTDPQEYTLGPGDSISIRVYNQENLGGSGKIRSDGRLALPLVGEVTAAGKHPQELAREIEARLKQFIVTPQVTVNLEESRPITVSVLGEVGTRGALSLPPSATLVQALAQAGGPTEYANRDAIFVLRQVPTFRRIRFSYDALIKNEQGAAKFVLRSGDVIVVE